MKATFLTIGLFFLCLTSNAKMVCNIAQTIQSQTMNTTEEIEIDPSNAHGSTLFLDFAHRPNLTGMIAYLRGYAVISVTDAKTNFGFSSTGKITNPEDIAHFQLLLPSDTLKVNAIVIDCQKLAP